MVKRGGEIKNLGKKIKILKIGVGKNQVLGHLIHPVSFLFSLPLTLPHLTTFNISHNKLLAIPDSIFAFIHLRVSRIACPKFIHPALSTK